MQFPSSIRVRLAALTLTSLDLLQSAAVRADLMTFANPAPITIPDVTTAVPYPSSIPVTLGGGAITDVTATITGFSHAFIADVDILLVAPDSTRIQLMSFVGSGAVTSVSYTFADGAPGMPFLGSPPSGTYSPTQFRTSAYPAPAPGLPYGTALSAFDGIDPNGVWNLFVVDRSGGDVGVISGGWSLTITTAGVAVVPEASSVLFVGLSAAVLGFVACRRSSRDT